MKPCLPCLMRWSCHHSEIIKSGFSQILPHPVCNNVLLNVKLIDSNRKAQTINISDKEKKTQLKIDCRFYPELVIDFRQLTEFWTLYLLQTVGKIIGQFVLFNDGSRAHWFSYHLLLDVKQMVIVTYFFRGDPLLPHRLLFPISSKCSFICTFPQTGQHIPLMDQLWTNYWLEWKIAQTVNASAVQDRSDNRNLHRWVLYRLSYVPLPGRIIDTKSGVYHICVHYTPTWTLWPLPPVNHCLPVQSMPFFSYIHLSL